tara:strand:+ start:571 stop:711 length:141 start_codon:yes stop_codon:yes gene_type:complete
MDEEANFDEKTWAVPVERMFDDILAKSTHDGDGTDNMTCILIKFKK